MVQLAAGNVAPSAAAESDTTTIQRKWRSRGWIPLAYAKSALWTSSRNVFLPLHPTVMQAAVRELLILDGTLDASTLQVSTAATASFMCTSSDPSNISNVAKEASQRWRRKEESSTAKNIAVVQAARYLGHLHPLEWTLAPKTSVVIKPSKNKSKRKRKTEEDVVEEQEIKTEETDVLPSLPVKSSSSSSTVLTLAGETVADAIVQRSRLICSSSTAVPSTTMTGVELEEAMDVLPQNIVSILVSRPPRKISDQDYCSILASNQTNSLPTTLITEQIVGPRDISRFANLRGGAITAKRHLPSLLEASIATETTLRGISFQMTASMCQTFSNRTLCLFLGYKTPALQRERLEQVLSGFLFDTSHAMFAWQQTERELRATDKAVNPLCDVRICASLFDSRALRKIGGFDKSSLLPQAISCQRLEQEEVSWEAFAVTPEGKDMLRHHASVEESTAVGQRRRGQRLRHRQRSANSAGISGLAVEATGNASCTQPEAVGSSAELRFRSSSFGSLDTDDTPSATDETPFFAEIPSACDVRLVRERGTSWGVLLSKEGEMCVVVRGSKVPTSASYSACAAGEAAELCSGDLILHVENERGEVALSPSFYSMQGKSMQNQQEWFRSIVDLFKTSQELNLIIQRVGV
jgi:hypothetical protein